MAPTYQHQPQKSVQQERSRQIPERRYPDAQDEARAYRPPRASYAEQMAELSAERKRKAIAREAAQNLRKAISLTAEDNLESRIQSDLRELRESWDAFLREKGLVPPEPLPLDDLDRDALLTEFLKRHHVWRPEAVLEFKTQLTSDRGRAVKLVDRLRKLLSFAAITTINRTLRNLLSGCKLSLNLQGRGDPIRQRIESSSSLLRQNWGEPLDSQKNVLAVHRDEYDTIVHLGAGRLGDIYLTVKPNLDPEKVAVRFLKILARILKFILPSQHAIAVVDGSYESINFKEVFQGSFVVRSFEADSDRLAANIRELNSRTVPKDEDTAIHSGVPRTPAELAGVFGVADWLPWAGVATEWDQAADRNGFQVEHDCTPQTILNSLATKKNVIVIVAHAEETRILLYSPPPNGSVLSCDEILKHSEQIRSNRPVVYLFCCETAKIGSLKNISQALLSAGASAVIAPQSKISADPQRGSLALFEGLTKQGRPSEVLVGRLRETERRTKFRQMETWIG